MVQLGAIRVDEDTKQVKQTLDVVIRPDGWMIPAATIEVHGITQEYAASVGVPEKLAVQMIMEMSLGCKRIAYNTTFDNRIIRIAAKRYLGDLAADCWKEGEYECAMILARKVMGEKSNQKLEVAYKHFVGSELIGAHNALNDTYACMAVYFAAKEQAELEAA